MTTKVKSGVIDADSVSDVTLVLETPIATTSGTAHDFTVPSWAKRITMFLSAVSLSGTDHMLIQIGDAGGIETTGYTSTSIVVVSGASSSTAATSTAGFIISLAVAATTLTTKVTLDLVNASTNTWKASGVGHYASNNISLASGEKALSAALTTVRLTRSGTDTFDAGAVTIHYE